MVVSSRSLELETEEPPTSSTASAAFSPNTLQDVEERSKATTANIRPEFERRMSDYDRIIIKISIFVDPSEWNSNEVLGWFQSYKLDEYINS